MVSNSQKCMHVNKHVSMLGMKYICIGNNGKLLSTFYAKWLQTTKKGTTTTTLWLCHFLSCSSQLKMGVKGGHYSLGAGDKKNVFILFKSLLFSSMMSFIAPIINLTSFYSLNKKEKIRLQTDGRRDGRINRVTTSLLELLIAAKNSSSTGQMVRLFPIP